MLDVSLSWEGDKMLDVSLSWEGDKMLVKRQLFMKLTLSGVG